jgi:hypothetical protein
LQNTSIQLRSNSVNIRKSDGCYEVSRYKGAFNQLTAIELTAKIKIAFPKLENLFFDVLIEQARKIGFSDERFSDAVDFVLQNFIYQTPASADFLKFDKTIKVFTYEQMLKKLETDGKAFMSHKAVRIYESQKKPIWATINDIEKFKLKIWDNAK